MYDILLTFSFKPKYYVHKRKKYGWSDLHMIRLNKKDSKDLLLFLNTILKKIQVKHSFQELKYDPAEI